MSLSADFSPIAHQYDATRNLPIPILMTCFDLLVESGCLPVAGRIFDAGCGTGQLSLPLAERGLQVVGTDISFEMIAIARSKSDRFSNVEYKVGDVCVVDEPSGSFHSVLVSKLFQHVQDWKVACRELVRVLRPGGHLIQVNERGAFGNPVRMHFAELAAARGYRSGYVGLDPHSEVELIAHMADLGCSNVALDLGHLKWSTSITHGDALSQIEGRLFAEFWNIPSEGYADLVQETRNWIETLSDGAATLTQMEPYLVVTGFRAPS